MAEQQTAAIILARGGSKGIPGKNLVKIGGVSLVGRSVRAARAARGVDAGVWVSTDDAGIAAEARAHGASVIDRPAEISGDGASSESGWLHALQVIRGAHPGVSRLVFLQCTSPFTTGPDIDACLEAQAAQGADCALSVLPDHGFLWATGPDGFARGTNHDETQPRKRRQELAPSYLESGAVYTVDAAAFETSGSRFCGRVALAVLDHPPVEIDTPDDLAVVAAIAAVRDRAPVDPARLRALRAVVMDFDGVHTDDLVDTDQGGTETVRTSRRDGMGMGLLRQDTDLRLMILSKEQNPVVAARARKLQIEVHHGVDNKAQLLSGWLTEAGLRAEDVLYVGNDVNDIEVMAMVGLSACPSDAHPSALAAAEWVLPHPGGRGALRAMADQILAARTPAQTGLS
jgi:N-acylneuraminate cytidylyltransferase